MLNGIKWLGSATGMILSFAYLALVLNPIQMLSILIYPLSPKACLRINQWCARSIWGWWVLMAEVQNNIDVRITGDRLPMRENAFVTANHQSIADVMVLFSLGWRCGRVGDMKWFVKDILKWIPGPGWGMYMLNCVFLKRNWAKDKADVMALFSKFKKRDIPVFLISFLEGTRITPEKVAAAQAFARERGMYVPEKTLVPRTKGFVATLHGLGDHLDAVYDLTICYPEGIPSIGACFLRKVRRVDIHVKRYPISDFQRSDAELADWVFERYREKDELLLAHAENQSFPGEVTYGPVNPWDYFKSESKISVD